jgi:hypothetical protein
MRACFLGQNVCALGFGVATLQTPKLEVPPDLPPTGTPARDWPAGRQDGLHKSFAPLPAGGSQPSAAP